MLQVKDRQLFLETFSGKFAITVPKLLKELHKYQAKCSQGSVVSLMDGSNRKKIYLTGKSSYNLQTVHPLNAGGWPGLD